MASMNLTTVTEFILVGLPSERKTQILVFVVILLIYLLTIMGNLVIILLVWTDSSLHTPMYSFLSQLSTLEICYVTSTLPQMLAHLMAGNGTISFTHCVIQMYIASCLGGTECLLLAAMAYDRYLAICQPLLYSIAMGKWRQFQLTFISWASAFFLGSVNLGYALSLPFCGPNHINHFFCELPVVLKLSCADPHVTDNTIFLASALLLPIPISVILISYGLILHSVLQMQSTSRWQKAFSTCASHLIVVTMFYGTVVSMYMIPRSGSTSDFDKQIAVFYIVITLLLNPIIYTLRNKDVHAAAAKMLGRYCFDQKKLNNAQNK